MNPFDWLLAALLLYSVVRAIFRGFLQESFALAGLVLGFLLACWSYQALAQRLTGLINNLALAQFAAFLLLLIATMLLASLLGRILKKAASAIGLGFVDRLLGALFGLLRGALLGTALLLAFTAFLPAAPWIANSTLAPYFLRAAHTVSFVMPADLRLHLHEGAQHLKHTTPDWIKHASLSHTG